MSRLHVIARMHRRPAIAAGNAAFAGSEMRPAATALDMLPRG